MGDVDQSPGRIDLAPGVHVAQADVDFDQARAGGAGGQHVNKTATKVLLRVAVPRIVGLGGAARARLRKLAGQRLTAGDELVLQCDETRSAARNRELVVERLAAMVAKALIAPKPRKKTRPGKRAIQRRIDAKKQQGEKKARRRRLD